ncbi:MAG: hypothetical protein WC489_04400 [Patescibacteria group bacterium]
MATGEGRAKNPFDAAAAIRGQMTTALREDQWFSEVIPENVAACLVQLPSDIFTHHDFSILLQPAGEGQGVNVAAGATRQVALETFRGWAQSPHTIAKNTFFREAYRSLYRVFQGAAQGAGIEAWSEIAEYFSRVLAEQDEEWTPFLERVALHGDIAGDQDTVIIHQKMQELWDMLSRSARSELASFSPEHLFQS